MQPSRNILLFSLIALTGCASHRSVAQAPPIAAVAAAAQMPAPWKADANDPYNACLANLANAGLMNHELRKELVEAQKKQGK